MNRKEIILFASISLAIISITAVSIILIINHFQPSTSENTIVTNEKDSKTDDEYVDPLALYEFRLFVEEILNHGIIYVNNIRRISDNENLYSSRRAWLDEYLRHEEILEDIIIDAENIKVPGEKYYSLKDDLVELFRLYQVGIKNFYIAEVENNSSIMLWAGLSMQLGDELLNEIKDSLSKINVEVEDAYTNTNSIRNAMDYLDMKLTDIIAIYGEDYKSEHYTSGLDVLYYSDKNKSQYAFFHFMEETVSEASTVVVETLYGEQGIPITEKIYTGMHYEDIQKVLPLNYRKEEADSIEGPVSYHIGVADVVYYETQYNSNVLLIELLFDSLGFCVKGKVIYRGKI